MFSPYRFPILAMALLLILPGLSACQKTNAPSSQDLPQVSMVLTHEIATDLDITDITFIPNTLAHWLGKIALLDKQGRLFVTDIEGGKVVPVGTHTYRDMVGLLRPKAPGLLFALNTNGQIEAFREDDEDGRFHPLKVVSDSLELKQFCHPATLATDQISGLS
ncbi:MAG TPA: hypothetical protein ENK01_01140, partial [Hellea balneolensis]|nr:hypothetical protein [Hellea balneolensis]